MRVGDGGSGVGTGTTLAHGAGQSRQTGRSRTPPDGAVQLSSALPCGEGERGVMWPGQEVEGAPLPRAWRSEKSCRVPPPPRPPHPGLLHPPPPRPPPASRLPPPHPPTPSAARPRPSRPPAPTRRLLAACPGPLEPVRQPSRSRSHRHDVGRPAAALRRSLAPGPHRLRRRRPGSELPRYGDERPRKGARQVGDSGDLVRVGTRRGSSRAAHFPGPRLKGSAGR